MAIYSAVFPLKNGDFPIFLHSYVSLPEGIPKCHKPKLGMVTMAQGLNLKIIHSAIHRLSEFRICRPHQHGQVRCPCQKVHGWFLSYHSWSSLKSQPTKRKIHGLPWFTHIHLEKKHHHVFHHRFHGYSHYGILIDRVTVWPQRRGKKNILIRIVSIDGCLNQLLHPMIFPFYPHCIRTFGWLNHVKSHIWRPGYPSPALESSDHLF